MKPPQIANVLTKVCYSITSCCAYQRSYIVLICMDVDSKVLETEIAKHILSLDRTPIAWEEALFRTDVVSQFAVTIFA